ncbi:MAG: hypothetical protein ACOH14_14235 [Rhodoglobus sp.]
MVHMRYNGDYSFRKRVNAGIAVSEIVEIEAAAVAEGAARVAAARRAERDAQRVPRPRAERAAGKPRVDRPTPAERERARVESVERRKGERAAARDRKRVERATLLAERRAERALERQVEREKRAALTAEQRAQESAAKAEERRVAAAGRRAERALPRTPKPIVHGTNAGYARGCRCVSCVEGHRAYHREYTARRRREAIAVEKHGTPYGYQLGCKERSQCPAETSCADASLAEESRRRREQGIPERDLVPAGPVRAHIVELHRTMPYSRIGVLAGIASKDIRRLVTGRDDVRRKGELAQHTDRSKAERILAISGVDNELIVAKATQDEE